MNEVRLKNTDLDVSRACLGTMTFGNQTAEPEARLMVDACIDHGVTFFDTANIYNQGKSEEVLGRAIGGRRSRVVLATKVRGRMGDQPDESGLSPKAIVKAIDASLKRLGADYIDIYYFHQPDYGTPVVESLAAMSELVKAGKVRYPGLSNYAAWQVAGIHALCEREGLVTPFITQPMYNLLARSIETEFLPMARHYGCSTAVYNPLAGGLLTGKQPPDAPVAGSRFDGNALYLNRYWHPQTFAAVDEFRVIAGATGRSMISLALNWLLHHTASDCVILGASNLDQIKDNLAACEEGPLPAETVVDCDGVWARIKGVAAQYCR